MAEDKPADREPTLRDRIAQLEKIMHVFGERLEESDAQLRRLTREVGIDD